MTTSYRDSGKICSSYSTEINGEPWLVGKDVALALGYSNTKKALADHVDPEDKILEDGVTIRDPMGREQHPTIINESGLYSLVLSSKLPGAKKFKRWVTADVLPSIRQHGAYMTPDTLDKMITSPEFGIKLLTALKDEQEKRMALEEKAEADRPKVLFADSVTASKSSILIGEMAKLLKQNGMETGQNRFFETLREKGYLIKRKGTDYNMPLRKLWNWAFLKSKRRLSTILTGIQV